ncbi:MAG: RIP metalloprotease RseP [Deltaproteobacteria bacterium]|nr:RIP metalloprotease RseP [Deltaproteobacteria bacterium]
MISNSLVFIVVLGILISAHEFGHFIVAKLCGVGVLRFSIGFGPAILKWKWGETRYSISLIPLGGYVRMVGDMPEVLSGPQATDEAVRKGDSANSHEQTEKSDLSPEERALSADRSRWFIEKPLLQRSAIVFAGPLFNFLLAWLMVTSCIAVFGQEKVDEAPVIGSTMAGYPAEAAGIKAQDRAVLLNGSAVESWLDLSERIRSGDGSEISIKVLRAGEELEFSVKPQRKEIGSGSDAEAFYLIGIGPSLLRHDATIGEATASGLIWIYGWTAKTLGGLWGMISGQVSPKELAGPIFIFQEAGRQAQKGVEQLVYFVAVLSISLAVLNLLPIPVLDGGHLLFFLLEAIMGPISIKKREIAQQVGLVFLLLLMGLAIRNDIVRKLDIEDGSSSDAASDTSNVK